MPRPPRIPRPMRAGRRGRKALPEEERKDKLIQTRVADNLESTLREQAQRQRITVSQLIRNVLEDTFHLVDGVVAQTAALTEVVRRDALRLAASAKGEPREGTPAISEHPVPAAPAKGADAPADLSSYFAWQEVVMSRPEPCAKCAIPLAKGGKALLGLSDDPSARRAFLCLPCGSRF